MNLNVFFDFTSYFSSQMFIWCTDENTWHSMLHAMESL